MIWKVGFLNTLPIEPLETERIGAAYTILNLFRDHRQCPECLQGNSTRRSFTLEIVIELGRISMALQMALQMA